jgi:two-component system sensor kinase FixL
LKDNTVVNESPSLDTLMGFAFECAPSGAIIVDAAGVILRVNSQIERCFGYAREELVGQAIEILLPESYRHAHVPQRLSFISGGQARTMGARRNLSARRKDGVEFPVEIGLNPVTTQQGVVILASIIDISARMAEEAALRESEERLRAVMENVLDGVLTIDERGIMQSVNPAAERIFGYSATELLGRNIAMLMPEPDHSQHDGYLANYCQTGEAKIIGVGREVTGRRKDGTTFPMDLAVSAFHLGGARAFAGLVRDITQRKEAEAQIKFYSEALQAQNAELQRSNQELDDFAYIASHDLKEPLRGIHNYSSFLIEDYSDKLDADGHNKLETIKRLTQRLEDLIDSLLKFSRVGRLDLAVQETDLNDVVADVGDSLAINLRERDVELRMPRPLPSVRCDRVRIGEVFRNLIVNAMKYNDKPIKWIEVGYVAAQPLDAEQTDGGEMTFYVRDNGIGIPEKHLDAVFRIFKRLHSRDKFGGGTGVGLPIVKKIVERHGGRIWIESKFGEGSSFNFTLGSET